MMDHLIKKLVWITLFSLSIIGCSSTPETFPEKSVSYHEGFQTDSKLAQYFEQSEFDTSVKTGFYPLDKGHDALLMRLALIEAAENSLDVQYYIYRSDESGQLMSWRLIEAANRGVKVRLLLDDMQVRDDTNMARVNAHPNIEIRLFNPNSYRKVRGLGFLKEFDRLNRRMHNKSITADNVASIVGGRNVGNEYFSFKSAVEFGDFDVLLYGNTVEQTSDQFDLYWNSPQAVPFEWIVKSDQSITIAQIDEAISQYQLEEKFDDGVYEFEELDLYKKLIVNDLPLHWGEGQLLYDKPEKVDGEKLTMIDSVAEVLRTVEHSLVLISPYFVPTQTGAETLAQASKSGKDITIITNSLASNDVFAVHGWYAKTRETLLEGGIKLYEMKPHADLESSWSWTGSSRSSLHAKVMILDEEDIFVGSMNWDPRSAYLNTEMAVLIHQPEYSQFSVQEVQSRIGQVAYELSLNDGNLEWYDVDTDKIYTSEPKASIWLRSAAWLSGILPIEDQL